MEVLLDLVLEGDPRVSFCTRDQAAVLDAGIGHTDSSSMLHTDGIPGRWVASHRGYLYLFVVI